MSAPISKELSAALVAFENAAFSCGDWTNDDEVSYETLTQQLDAARAALVLAIEKEAVQRAIPLHSAIAISPLTQITDMLNVVTSAPAAWPDVTWEFRRTGYVPRDTIYVVDMSVIAPGSRQTLPTVRPRFIILADRELTFDEQRCALALWFDKVRP